MISFPITFHHRLLMKRKEPVWIWLKQSLEGSWRKMMFRCMIPGWENVSHSSQLLEGVLSTEQLETTLIKALERGKLYLHLGGGKLLARK